MTRNERGLVGLILLIVIVAILLFVWPGWAVSSRTITTAPPPASAQSQSTQQQGTSTSPAGRVAPATAVPPVTGITVQTGEKFAAQPLGWCSVPAGNLQQQSLNWDGAGRLWMSDRVVADLVALGGNCQVDLGVRQKAIVNSIAGNITVDGTSVQSGNSLSVEGTRIIVNYNPGVPSNGLEILAPGAAASGPGSQTLGSCTVNGTTTPLEYDGRLRVWMKDSLVQPIKKSGGTCTVDWGSVKTFTVNSVEGRASVDGTPIPKGNGVKATGKVFTIQYDANNTSNGFDLFLVGGQ